MDKIQEIMVLSVANLELWIGLPKTFSGWLPGVRATRVEGKKPRAMIYTIEFNRIVWNNIEYP